jgi:hypothetical protein
VNHTPKKALTEAQVIFIPHSVINRVLLGHFKKKGILMISISEEPQFSAEDIYEIPAEVGRTYFEFDTGLIEVCRPLYQGYYDSHELLANELSRAGVIRVSDVNLSTKNALIVRFKSQRASQTFITRLNTYLLKCIKQRESTLKTLRRREKEAGRFQKELGTHPISVA